VKTELTAKQNLGKKRKKRRQGGERGGSRKKGLKAIVGEGQQSLKSRVRTDKV